MKARRILLLGAVVGILLPAVSMDNPTPGIGSGIVNARYATDAYPGFDDEDEIVRPERKEPKWLSFLFGPDRETAAEQLAYCVELIRDESYSKARRQLDALVREWPTAPEAPKAQQALAELELDRLKDTEEAFASFRYLLDFYSSQCDYERIADKLYEVAGILQLEGKEVMFVRFENTVDVRRAYETCVLRAPGAKWVPEAMLTIGFLREKDGQHDKAIQVYENLRNLHPDAKEAKVALKRESAARMKLLRDYGYNRLRCRDTIDFLRLALTSCNPADAEQIAADLAEARALLEDEAYRSARFYDSPTRTRRSAISAYEKFLDEFPSSVHAEEIRARINVLKETDS